MCSKVSGVMLSEKDTTLSCCFFVLWVAVACGCVSFGAAFYHGIGIVPCSEVVEIVRYVEIIALAGDRRLASPVCGRKIASATTIAMFLEKTAASISSEQGKVVKLLLLLLRCVNCV